MSLGAFMIMQQPGVEEMQKLISAGLDFSEMVSDTGNTLGAIALRSASVCDRFGEIDFLLEHGVCLDQNVDGEPLRSRLASCFFNRMRMRSSVSVMDALSHRESPLHEMVLRPPHPGVFHPLWKFASQGILQDFMDHAFSLADDDSDERAEHDGIKPVEIDYLLRLILRESQKHTILHRTLMMTQVGDQAVLHVMEFLVGPRTKSAIFIPHTQLLVHVKDILQELAAAPYPLIQVNVGPQRLQPSAGDIRHDEEFTRIGESQAGHVEREALIMDIHHDEEPARIDESQAAEAEDEVWAQRVQMNVSVALQEYLPNKIFLITYRRFPDLFRAAILEGLELQSCRDGLRRVTFPIELGCGAKVLVQPYEYNFAMGMVGDYSLGKQHVIVSGAFDDSLSRLVSQLPSRANVRERERKVLFCPHEWRVNRTFVDISNRAVRAMGSVTNSTTVAHGGCNPRCFS